MNVNSRFQLPVQARKQADKANRMSFKAIEVNFDGGFFPTADKELFPVDILKELAPGADVRYKDTIQKRHINEDIDEDIYILKLPETIEGDDRKKVETGILNKLRFIPGYCSAKSITDDEFDDIICSIDYKNNNIEFFDKSYRSYKK